MTPVVRDQLFKRHVAQHLFALLAGHRLVRAQRGHYIHVRTHVGQRVIVNIGNIARVGMEAGKVRRQYQYVFVGAPFQRFQKRRAYFFTAEAVRVLLTQKYFHINILRFRPSRPADADNACRAGRPGYLIYLTLITSSPCAASKSAAELSQSSNARNILSQIALARSGWVLLRSFSNS